MSIISYELRETQVFLNLKTPTHESRLNQRTKVGQMKRIRRRIFPSAVNLPGCGAVPVKNVEVLAAEQLAPIDAGLNGSEAA